MKVPDPVKDRSDFNSDLSLTQLASNSENCNNDNYSKTQIFVYLNALFYLCLG